MRVIRQSELLGRTTRRRLVGVTASVSAAALEALAVSSWFFLVAFGTQSFGASLAGLGVLLCGCLLRTGVFDVAVGDQTPLVWPLRAGAAVVLATGWVLWLFVAESVGGTAGVAAAFLVLVGALAGQFALERRLVCTRPDRTKPTTHVLSAGLLAVGASALLVSVWFSNWAITFEATTLFFRFEAGHLGAIVFGLFAFLAHQRRFQRRLSP